MNNILCHRFDIKILRTVPVADDPVNPILKKKNRIHLMIHDHDIFGIAALFSLRQGILRKPAGDTADRFQIDSSDDHITSHPSVQ